MTKKLWGGRFKKNIDEEFEVFSRSIQYDYKLAEYDILHSLLHVAALLESSLITQKEAAELDDALTELLAQVQDGVFKPDMNSEDIHSDIQNKLEKKTGKTALKLHTLRSRNDQIAFDVKFYCFARANTISQLLSMLVDSFTQLSLQYEGEPFVGYTHMQRAQVIKFSDYAGAYAAMIRRDHKRMKNYAGHLDIGIGAGALAGSSIPHKAYSQAIREMFEENTAGIAPVTNALEHVSDRDFVIEFMSILAIIQMHISRFAEDMLLYSTSEFNYVDLPEEFCTGSSLMPHKKNVDFLELARGYTGRIYGGLISELTMMKGLPLSYNRDMQLDKEPLFYASEYVEDLLSMMIRFVAGIKLNHERITQALSDENLYAVEIAEYLVHEGVAFKDAHDIVGRMVSAAAEKKIKLSEIPQDELSRYHGSLTNEQLKKIVTPQYAVSQKRSIKRK